MDAKEAPSRRRLFLFADSFSLGVLVPFTLVGAAFAGLGVVVRSFFQPFTYVLASALVLMGLLHIMGKEFSLPVGFRLSNSKGFLGSFQRGIIYGLGAADCAIMILAPIFFFSLTLGNFWVNIANFVFFGLGRSFPIILSSLLMPDFLSRFVAFFSRRALALRIGTGSMIMGSGLLLFLAQF